VLGVVLDVVELDVVELEVVVVTSVLSDDFVAKMAITATMISVTNTPMATATQVGMPLPADAGALAGPTPAASPEAEAAAANSLGCPANGGSDCGIAIVGSSIGPTAGLPWGAVGSPEESGSFHWSSDMTHSSSSAGHPTVSATEDSSLASPKRSFHIATAQLNAVHR